jgi:hypothetical protein
VDPAVRVEVDGEVHAARARVLNENDEAERARSLVYAKYAPRNDRDLSDWRDRASPIALDLDVAPDPSDAASTRAAAPGPYPGALDERLLTPRAPLPPGAGMRVLPVAVDPFLAPSSPPAWAPDPTGRHQWRWWGGTDWTDHVADDGVAGEDPLEDGSSG